MSEDDHVSRLPWLSIIVPTRGRPAELRRFIASLDATVADPEGIDLVLVTDLDDPSYKALPRARMRVKHRRVSPKLTMGNLNCAGYEAASGAWVFLLNDDVVAKTEAWDRRLKEGSRIFADEICLLHVNDGIFGDKLCTFPLVSRKFCEIAGGICPEEYNRYRIDDHIYNIFNLLNFGGYNRIVFVDDVLFDHNNRTRKVNDHSAYQPDPIFHALDTEIFDALLPRRKEIALDLSEHIESVRTSERRRILAQRLIEVPDSTALRRPEYVSVLSPTTSIARGPSRVTIGLVSADLRSKHAELCIESVKRFTSDFDLVLLDNNRVSAFNHPREMNRILSICRTDFAVLMDDDVIVEPGWLDGMLKAMSPDVGVVTPLHKTSDGRLSYAGVVMRPDDSGHHGHDFAVPQAPIALQTLCSAIMLIDVRKCGHVRIDESYSKYFLDLDYGLKVWETGYRVVLSPFTMVTHIAGATLLQGSAQSNDLYEIQRLRFVERWMHSGRWERLQQTPQWRSDPHLKRLASFRSDFEELLRDRAPRDRSAFETKLQSLFELTTSCPVLHNWAVEAVAGAFGSVGPVAITDENAGMALLVGHFMQPVLVESGVFGTNVVLANGEYFAVPQDEGAFTVDAANRGQFSRLYRAPDFPTLKLAIRADLRDSTVASTADSPTISPPTEEPCLIEEGYRGFNVVAYSGVYYGIPQSQGPFCGSAIGTETYNGFPKGSNAEAVRHQIDAALRLTPRRVLGAARRLAGRAVRAARRRLSRRQGRGDHAPPPASTSVMVNPENWLQNSPVVLVQREHRNHDIYKFEYKFFAVPMELGSFDYTSFKSDGRLSRCQIGQSLEEARALVRAVSSNGKISPHHYLLLGGNRDAGESFLARRGAPPGKLVLAAAPGKPSCDADEPEIRLPITDDSEIGRYLLSDEGAAQRSVLKSRNFTDAVIPWTQPGTWRDNSFETAAAQIAPIVHVVLPKGETMRFIGEGVHRLIYNKAYLASLFSKVSLPENQRVLEVGCSDGMVSYMLAGLGAQEVTGIDIMETAGCCFPHPRVHYKTCDAHALPFESNSFDLVVSIATLEHLYDPARAISEIVRVLRPSGHAYIQAGPLYHSPFGHHMFGYFDGYPWIHLRMSPDEIAEYARSVGVAERIERDHGRPVAQYVRDMLRPEHINGLTLQSYALDDLDNRPDVSVLMKNISHEGNSLLDKRIRAELPRFSASTLTEHGFEVLLTKTSVERVSH